MELFDQPLSTLAQKIRTREVKSIDLVKDCLDRISKVNPELNAMVYNNGERALKYATKADTDLENGQYHGPLHGIPMTIKDSLDTKDTITTWGTEGRREFVPGRDATCVGRLRDAGAILVGKTNTPEFTLSFQTSNDLFGSTRNPFNTTRTPGGSSGGAAALIAAGASLFDVGTDTGGSIRLPAHFSGIAGIKPTSGRVPCTGNALPSSGAIAPLSQPGPMGRSVADLTLLLELMSGPDLLDPNAVDAAWRSPDDVEVSELRVGFHTSNGIKKPQSEIIDAVEKVVDLLKHLGNSVTEARPPGLEMSQFVLGRVFSLDGGEMVDALLEDSKTTKPSAKIQESLDYRHPMDQFEIAQSLILWDNFRSSMLGFFKDHDVLICPANATTAIALGAVEDLSGYTYTSAYNLTGWPGVVIRCGQDDQGLPIGVQILAKPFREDHCLAVAQWLEQQLGDFDLPEIHAG